MSRCSFWLLQLGDVVWCLYLVLCSTVTSCKSRANGWRVFCFHVMQQVHPKFNLGPVSHCWYVVFYSLLRWNCAQIMLCNLMLNYSAANRLCRTYFLTLYYFIILLGNKIKRRIFDNVFEFKSIINVHKFILYIKKYKN